MPYMRVIPRDLFNESKLLKCLGQLSLLIHDGRVPVLGLQLEHDDSEDPGFVIDQNPDDGGLFCRNLQLLLWSREIPLYAAYNSKDAYPLFTEDYVRVLDEGGNLSKEFAEMLTALDIV